MPSVEANFAETPVITEALKEGDATEEVKE